MLVARLSNGTFIVGIEERNVELLKQKKPFVLDLRLHGGHDFVALVYGKTLDEVMADIRSHVDVPPAKPMPPAAPSEADNASLQAAIEGGREMQAALKALTALHGEPIVHMASMMANAHHAICVMQDENIPIEIRTRHALNMINVVFDSYIDVVEIDRRKVYKVASGLHDDINRIQTDATIAAHAAPSGEEDGHRSA